MGGMIAQRLALGAPDRVMGLVSIMSSSGASDLPDPDPVVLKHMFAPAAQRGVAGAVEHHLRLLQLIASPAYPQSDAVVREQIEQAMRRSHKPAGILRQTVAVMADDSRAAALYRMSVPTLVIHGDADRMVPLACGQDTARRIPGAELHIVPGMGHDLAPGACQRMLQALIPFLLRHTPLT
jgi:pimeloyl-ACP methyl ester carboxylesterase